MPKTEPPDRGDPFTDMAGHWSADYVTRLYKLGLTTGYGQARGIYRSAFSAENGAAGGIPAEELT